MSLTVERPVPHQTGDGLAVPDVPLVGQRLVQSHAEQVHAVVKRSDEEVHLRGTNDETILRTAQRVLPDGHRSSTVATRFYPAQGYRPKRVAVTSRA